jgi:hypothetical protein
MTKSIRTGFLLLLLAHFVQTAYAADLTGMKRRSKPMFARDYAPANGSFILSGQTTVFSFNTSAPTQSNGLGAEYYFGKNWSIRGGLVVGPGYFKFTPAPLTAELMKTLVSRDYHGHRYGRNSGRALMYLFASLAMNDGIGYNFPLGQYVHLMPYAGTWQVEMKYNGADSNWQESDHCSTGVCLKIQTRKHIIIDLGAEYDRSALLSDSAEGYRITFSVGYKFS